MHTKACFCGIARAAVKYIAVSRTCALGVGLRFGFGREAMLLITLLQYENWGEGRGLVSCMMLCVLTHVPDACDVCLPILPPEGPRPLRCLTVC